MIKFRPHFYHFLSLHLGHPCPGQPHIHQFRSHFHEVTMQFCALSKLELCQVMFYVVCKEMKSWTAPRLASLEYHQLPHDWMLGSYPPVN